MTVALEVFSAFILEECASRGNRGTKRRRGKDEEEEELKGLKAAEDAADKKKMKLSSLPITALRYLQGLDAYVAAGKKRKASVLGADNQIDSFKVSSTGNNRAIKRPREDECLLAIAAIAFEALPTEMLWLIVTNYLGAKEVCLLSSTCHFFAGLSRSEELWKVLYARDFGLVLPTQFHVRFSKSWLWLYQSRAVFFNSRAQIAGPKVGSLVDNNVHFSGDWLDGKFHGYGIAIALPGEGMWDAGLVCEGEWRADALHGFGKETYPDGEFLEGNWVNNALCGQGMRKWKDGGVYKGDFVDSLPHGKGLMVYPSAGGTYVGEWKEGKRHGQGVMIYSDKTKYAGLWFNDKRNGQGIVHYADGGQYKGEWSEDLRHGFGSMKWPSGNVRLYEGGWRNDKQDGRGVCYYADGNRFEGCWMQNKVLTSLRRSL